MRSKSLSFLIATILGLPAPSALAEADVIVVTAAGFSQNLTDAPASISVITREELEKKVYYNITDAVRDIEGINVIGTNANEKDISIRGMPGSYTLILVDGKRQSTRESRPNGSDGFEANFTPPLEAIDRIEVIRGPMSSLYGSDAIGGVINIITRKVSNKWTSAVQMDTTIQENSEYGNIYQSNIYSAGPLIDNLLGLQVYGRIAYRPEDKIIGGVNENKNQNFGAKLSFTPNENHDFIFEGGHAIQKRESTPGKSIAYNINAGAGIRPASQTQYEHRRNNWSIAHTGRWGFITSDLSYSYEEAKRTGKTYNIDKTTGVWSGGTDARKPEIKNNVFDAKFTLPLPYNTLTFGGQYQKAKLSDDSTVDRGKTEIASMSTNQKALFFEDEIAITDNLLLTGGVRFDDHEKYGNHWNPRGYIVYHLTDEITLRGGAAKAFRAPTLREISPGYGLATQRGAGVIYGNPDLKPETSTSQEIGISYNHNSGFNASLTLFNTDFKDKLTSYNTLEKDANTGLNLWTYENVGKANIKGIESSIGVPITDDWKAKINYTYLDSKRKSDEERFTSGVSLRGYPLALTPKHHVNFKLDWQATEDLSLYSRVTYTGKQIWAGQRNGFAAPRYRDALTTVDFGGTYAATKDVDLNFAVLNITDKKDDIDTQGGNWIIDDGRRYWISANIRF